MQTNLRRKGQLKMYNQETDVGSSRQRPERSHFSNAQ